MFLVNCIHLVTRRETKLEFNEFLKEFYGENSRTQEIAFVKSLQQIYCDSLKFYGPAAIL